MIKTTKPDKPVKESSSDKVLPQKQINVKLGGSVLSRLNFLNTKIYGSKTLVIIKAINALYWSLKNEGKLEPEHWINSD